MMRTHKCFLLLAVAVAIALPLEAQAAVWGVRTTIQGYYSDTGTTHNMVITTANNQNPSGCSSSQYLVIDGSVTNFNQLWATVMSAQATGSTVTLLYNGCLGSYPLISSVAVPGNW